MNALAFLILAGILAFVIWPRQFGRECRILCDKFMEGWRDP